MFPTAMEIDNMSTKESFDSQGSSMLSKSSSLESERPDYFERKPLQFDDVEAQTQKEPTHTPLEHTISTKTKLLFLFAWFLLNLILTLSNKSILGKARYPWLLTTLHTTATSLGCFALKGMGKVQVSSLGMRESLIMLAFSFLFTINIAMSTVSLAMVSVPFHQIMRSMCPAATIAIYRVMYKRIYSTATYLTMIPLILGVSLATVGDYYFTVIGFLLTALGVVLAAVKTVATNRLMTGSLALTAMEVLLRMSPLAAIQCIAYAYFTGEISTFRTELDQGHFGWPFALALVGNGAMAFALNVVSFQANKLAGALSMTVAGNVKQTLTILLGTFLFHVPTGFLSASGMAITIAGAVWYSNVELDSKRSRT